MKKITLTLLAAVSLCALLFTGCAPTVSNTGNNGGNQGNTEEQITKIYGSKVTGSFISLDLSSYAGKTIKADLSVKMKVENSGDTDPTNLMWQINTGNSKYPVIASKEFSKEDTEWSTVTGNNSGNSIELGDGAYFYLSTYQLTPSDYTIYLKDFLLTITVDDEETKYEINSSGAIVKKDSRLWTDVKSLKTVFVDGGYFDRFGLACEQDELGSEETAAGILYHANTTTPGNELKPQFVFWHYGAAPTLTTYTGSNGVQTKVPTDDWMKQQMAIKMDPYLKSAKDAGIQIRGHVLTWHSQTPDFFFEKDWKNDLSSGTMLTADEMTARHEWYIKTVLTHCAEWEAENGYAGAQTEADSGKKHLIYSWDVVNEAVSDSAEDSDTGYLRGAPAGSTTDPNKGGSRWYQIYGNADFIVNAFRFANAYAPSDVTLCYNDYNEYLNYDDGKGGSFKTKGIIRLLTAVKNGSEATVNGKSVKPRIDAMAMQSHVEPSWMNVNAYEGALKQFLALDLDVQVTEFDIATTKEDDTENWSDYFKMFIKYSKKGSEISKYNGHHITGLTIWGLNDENSWIAKPDSEGNPTQYALIFTKKNGKYYAKDCYYSVINSVK